MGTIQNGNFYSSYLGDQIDLLLGAMAQANPMPSGTDWVAFIDDCRAAQGAAEAAAGNAADSEADAEDAAQGAADSASAAAGSASAASASKTGADNAAILAESYAHGGTGTRTGEDTDNAKYYSEIAEQEADRAHRIAIEDYTAEDFPLSSTDDTTVAEAVAPLYAPTTVSGTIVTIDDGIEGAPVSNLVVNIEPAQEGEGDPSPNNVRPITGWAMANIKRYGTDESDNLLSLTIPFGDAGTVYGGTLDVTTGLLTVDRVSVDLGTLSWATISGYPNKFRAVNLQYPAISRYCDTICEKYINSKTYFSLSTVSDKSIGITGDNVITVCIKDTDYSAASTLKTSLNGVKFLYPIATPLTYQLTPQEVTTLAGVNNIYADCGDVTVTYRGDIANIYREIANLKTAILSLGGNV